MEERDRSSDLGLPPSPPSRLAPVASWRGSISPHSGGTVPDSHRVPSPCSLVWPSLSSDGVRHRPTQPCGFAPLRCQTPGSRRPLAAGAALGRAHLRPVVGAGSRHGARRLGSRPPEDRARRRVRGARGAAPARARRGRGSRSRSGRCTRSRTRSTSRSSRGGRARRSTSCSTRPASWSGSRSGISPRRGGSPALWGNICTHLAHVQCQTLATATRPVETTWGRSMRPRAPARGRPVEKTA